MSNAQALVWPVPRLGKALLEYQRKLNYHSRIRTLESWWQNEYENCSGLMKRLGFSTKNNAVQRKYFF